MIIPVKCFTCGKVIGHLYEPYRKSVDEGESPKEVLDKLELMNFCCRRIFLSHVNLIDDIIKYD